jgi:hypothetical protein
MLRPAVDPTLSRVEVGEFDFPLGVYPVTPAEAEPRSGYVTEFEQSDGDETGEWEEWPDRYMFDIVAPRRRIEMLCLSLFSLLPGRVFPILDVLSEDAYREIDPYIAYESVSFERFLDEVRRFRPWFFDDGMVGFGAMSLDPFVYVFVDEHKIVTARVETSLKERVEHRSILALELDGQQFASHAEIVERLRERWMLSLNLDWDSNTDDDGRTLGVCCWRVDVRRFDEEDQEAGRWEVLLAASTLSEAEQIAITEVARQLGVSTDDEDALRDSFEMLEAIRMRPEDFAAALGEAPTFDAPQRPGVRAVRAWSE